MDKRMSKEKKLLMTIFITYIITYASRIGWSIYQGYTILTSKPHPTRYDCWLYFLPSFWDCIPIGLLLYHHYKNFRVRAEKQREARESINKSSILIEEFRDEISLYSS